MPLVWYKDEDHVGYDLKGSRIMRRQKKDALDRLLDRNDSKKVRTEKLYAWCCLVPVLCNVISDFRRPENMIFLIYPTGNADYL